MHLQALRRLLRRRRFPQLVGRRPAAGARSARQPAAARYLRRRVQRSASAQAGAAGPRERVLVPAAHCSSGGIRLSGGARRPHLLHHGHDTALRGGAVLRRRGLPDGGGGGQTAGRDSDHHLQPAVSTLTASSQQGAPTGGGGSAGGPLSAPRQPATVPGPAAGASPGGGATTLLPGGVRGDPLLTGAGARWAIARTVRPRG